MNPEIFWQLTEAYRAGVYHQVNEDILTEEEYFDIQEWVESLIAEGYDLSDYTDDELYEAYLEDLYEAKEDEGLTPLQKIRKRNKEYFRNFLGESQQTSTRRAEHKSTRGQKKERGAKSAFGTMRHIGGPYNEEFDLYDVISDFLVNESYCDTHKDAEIIMANMSEEWRNSIISNLSSK